MVYFDLNSFKNYHLITRKLKYTFRNFHYHIVYIFLYIFISHCYEPNPMLWPCNKIVIPCVCTILSKNSPEKFLEQIYFSFPLLRIWIFFNAAGHGEAKERDRNRKPRSRKSTTNLSNKQLSWIQWIDTISIKVLIQISIISRSMKEIRDNFLTSHINIQYSGHSRKGFTISFKFIDF